jgi:hypothetical protein
VLLLAQLLRASPKPGEEVGSAAVRIVGVDLHDRLFPDRAPAPAATTRISVPRGAVAVFQFAATSAAAGTATVAVSTIPRGIAGRKFPDEAKVHVLRPVHVEGNTQGNKINRPSGLGVFLDCSVVVLPISSRFVNRCGRDG